MCYSKGHTYKYVHKTYLYVCTMNVQCTFIWICIIYCNTQVIDRVWRNYDFNFDNVPYAMLTLFSCGTGEGWPMWVYILKKLWLTTVQNTLYLSWHGTSNNKFNPLAAKGCKCMPIEITKWYIATHSLYWAFSVCRLVDSFITFTKVLLFIYLPPSADPEG